MTQRFAELLERAAKYAEYVAEERLVDLVYSGATTWATLKQAEDVRREAEADADDPSVYSIRLPQEAP